MSKATVRYVGPDTDGVLVPFEDAEYLCPHGEWVELPAALVHGTPHVFAEGYAPAPDEPIDSDYIVEFGRGGLAEQSTWEVQAPTKSKKDAPPAGDSE